MSNPSENPNFSKLIAERGLQPVTWAYTTKMLALDTNQEVKLGFYSDPKFTLPKSPQYESHAYGDINNLFAAVYDDSKDGKKDALTLLPLIADGGVYL